MFIDTHWLTPRLSAVATSAARAAAELRGSFAPSGRSPYSWRSAAFSRADGRGVGRAVLEAEVAIELRVEHRLHLRLALAVLGDEAAAVVEVGLARDAPAVHVHQLALDLAVQRGGAGRQGEQQIVAAGDPQRVRVARVAIVIRLDVVGDVRHRHVRLHLPDDLRGGGAAARRRAVGLLAGEEVAEADLVGDRGHVDAAHDRHQVEVVRHAADGGPEVDVAARRPHHVGGEAGVAREQAVAGEDARLADALGGEGRRVARVEREQHVPPAVEVGEDEAVVGRRQRRRLGEGLEGQATEEAGSGEAGGGLHEGAAGEGEVLLHGRVAPDQ